METIEKLLEAKQESITITTVWCNSRKTVELPTSQSSSSRYSEDGILADIILVGQWSLLIPLRLYISLRPDGSWSLWRYDWNGNGNTYIHISYSQSGCPQLQQSDGGVGINLSDSDSHYVYNQNDASYLIRKPTPEQIDTVAGWYFGERPYDIALGGTVCDWAFFDLDFDTLCNKYNQGMKIKLA